MLLHELGLDVHIYERSPATLEARGARIVVLPMTERYFLERGGEYYRVSLELPWWKYVAADGTELSATRTTSASVPGTPSTRHYSMRFPPINITWVEK